MASTKSSIAAADQFLPRMLWLFSAPSISMRFFFPFFYQHLKTHGFCRKYSGSSARIQQQDGLLSMFDFFPPLYQHLRSHGIHPK